MNPLALVLVYLLSPPLPVDEETGLVEAPGVELVRAHCAGCHSLRLVTQNRGDRAHWLKTIRWMQKTQNLWTFDGQTEDRILIYLSTHFAGRRASRRPALHPSLLPPRAVPPPQPALSPKTVIPARRAAEPRSRGCQCHGYDWQSAPSLATLVFAVAVTLVGLGRTFRRSLKRRV